MRTTCFILTALVSCLVCLDFSTHCQAQRSQRLVVTFSSPPVVLPTISNCTVIKQYGRRLVIELHRGVDLSSDEQWIRSQLGPDVQRVDADAIITQSQSLDSSPIDLIYSEEMSVDNTSYADSAMPFQELEVQAEYLPGQDQASPLWNLEDSEPYGIHVESVWRQTNSTPGVVVAVLDTGMAQLGYPQFLDTAPGYDFISDSALSLDSDGRDPDPTDPGDSGPDCPEPSWHGLRVSSILAAKHNNTYGMLGVAQNCSLMSVRVLGLCRTGYASDVSDAIVWASGGEIMGVNSTQSPARVISMSFAGQGACPEYLQSAINFAVSMGAVLVAAAGNQGLETEDYFPANCEGVLAVAASTRTGTLAPYSNYGADIALAAPGGDEADPIMMLSVNQGETSLQTDFGMGTSFAVPQVAGVAALAMAVYPGTRASMMGQFLLLNNTVCISVRYGIISASKLGHFTTDNLPAYPFFDAQHSNLTANVSASGYVCPSCAVQNAPLSSGQSPYSPGTTNSDGSVTISCNFGYIITYFYIVYDGDIEQVTVTCSDGAEYNLGVCNNYDSYTGESLCNSGDVTSGNGFTAMDLWQGGNLNGLVLYPAGGGSATFSSCSSRCEPLFTFTCPSGTAMTGFVGYMNSQSGSYGFNGIQPKCQPSGWACSAGTFWSNGNCVTCPSGDYCSGCSSCSPSTCSSGSYCPAGSGSQNLCTAGYYCPTTTTQTACTSGNYCPTGSIGQTQCAAGSYCPTTATQTACASGYYCPAGSTSQTQCAAGSYCPAGSATQSQCAAGYFCPTTANQTACSSGYYCPTGSTNQTLCAAGYYCPNALSTFKCTAGQYSAGGASTCTPCLAGQFSLSGANLCTACNPFTFAWLANSTACSVCSVGSYSTSVSSSVCSSCTPGTFSNGTSVCIACAVGTYVARSGAANCTGCTAGSYSSNTGLTVCIICPAGYYSNSAASACTACPIGTYGALPNASNGSCTACPAGSFSSSPGNTQCTTCSSLDCSAQWKSIGCSSSSDNSCVYCATIVSLPANAAFNADNTCQWTCDSCFYQTGGQCVQCALDASQCSVGQYRQSCTATANGPCLNCTGLPNNATFTGRGVSLDSPSSCPFQCNAGFWQSSGCVPCAPGTFNPTPGGTGCASCPGGSYANGTASSACLACTPCSLVGQYKACGPVSAGQCTVCTN